MPLSKNELNRHRAALAAPRFAGPIIDIRYVQLIDGRRIMQIAREPNAWATPATIMVQSLSDDERDEINRVLGDMRDANAR